jgi:perosamine synthetase
MKIPLAKPYMTSLEKDLVDNVLTGTKLSIGPYLEEFEALVAKYIGVKYAIAVNSGTSGLHLIVRALGLKEGDEVITTPFSFIASSNCLLYEKVTPIFVDIDPNTLNINIERIRERITSRTKAILGVDIFGYPLNWSFLNTLAKSLGLYLIDDSCEALGASWKDKQIGSWTNASTFGLYPNKQITTGEGGMITTDSNKIASLCRSMRNQGRDSSEWLIHDRLGYNYRLDEMSCAMGCAQMQRLDEILTKRREVANLYTELLSSITEVITPPTSVEGERSWFVYVIQIDNRDRIKKELEERGIQTGVYFPPIHLQPFYKGMFGYKEGDFPVTEEVSKTTLALPFYTTMTEEEVDYIAKNLKEVLS